MPSYAEVCARIFSQWLSQPAELKFTTIRWQPRENDAKMSLDSWLCMWLIKTTLYMHFSEMWKCKNKSMQIACNSSNDLRACFASLRYYGLLVTGQNEPYY
ncbi:unnamed protein product [Dicrocoelium dendriticum]|nr:unnamed protein product [Dicrocoelium dendriticum]